MNTTHVRDESVVFGLQSIELDAWAALAQAKTAEQLCQAWLPALCGMIADVQAGLLLLQDTDGSYAPAALWPPAADLLYLRGVAEEALGSRQGVLRKVESGNTQFAYPLASSGNLIGVVILDLRVSQGLAMTQAIRALHWGAGWLINLFSQRSLLEQGTRLERSAALLDLTLSALSEVDFRKAALSVVNQLAQRFKCHQVMLGLEKGKTVRVEVVSHSSWFDDKANLIHLAAIAMNEAFDQRARVVLPEPEKGLSLISTAHRKYASESGSQALCTLPLEAGNRLVGIWLLERDTPFSDEELSVLDALTVALGPILEIKLAAQEGLLSHAKRSMEHGLRYLTDSSHPGLKLLALVVALMLIISAIFTIDYRVAAQAVVEGSTQRVAVAPFQGYVQQAPARAGDVVRAGQVLAVLEDKDLQLERVRWEADLEVAQRKEQEAMSKADRVELRLATAQTNQARAQLDLAREKLARVNVLAPFDGVVVKGDLSQQLGSPVEQGKVLFEIAPLDTWRVILKVDERDIGYVLEGMQGQLMLTSLPGQSFAFHVNKVTPVAIAEEGRNYFRVEARLIGTPAKLRPNMEGVAKVVAGQRSLLWIWTHRLPDWLRLIYWSWMP